jgi:hypothetical protein
MKKSCRIRKLVLLTLVSLVMPLMTAFAAKETKTENTGISADAWLPIGSVVLLRNGSKSLMIVGRVVQNASDHLVYDYCACSYPEGYVSSQMYFFNQTDIAVIASKGYENEYELLYRKEILDGVDSANLVVVDGRMMPREEAGALSEETESEKMTPETDPRLDIEMETEMETEETELIKAIEEDHLEAPLMEESESLPKQETESGETEAPTRPALEMETESAPEPAAEAESETEDETDLLAFTLTAADKLGAESEAPREAKRYKVAQNLNLRENPSTDANILVTISGGAEVMEDVSRKPEKEWVPVSYRSIDGTVMNGWVNAEFLQEE